VTQNTSGPFYTSSCILSVCRRLGHGMAVLLHMAAAAAAAGAEAGAPRLIFKIFDLVTPLPHCGFFCGFYTWTCNGLFLREAGAPRRASLGTRVRRVATKCKPQNLTTNLMKSFWLLPKSITRGNTSCRDTCIYIYIYHVNMCIYISAGDVVVSKLH